ncbi:MAG: hypothetical protein AAF393_07825 [Pseudomonadota bacterium]
MGLAVEVGYLADMMANDPEGAEWALSDFEALNDALQAKGLPTHDEPATGSVWSADLIGYEGILALRELAAITWAGAQIPRNRLIDGHDTQHSDDLVASFLEHLSGSAQLTLLGRALKSFFKAKEPHKKPPFLHLIMHSSHDGYYVPVPLELPFVPKRVSEETEHLWPLGSTLGLEAELKELSGILSLPVDMTHDDTALQTHLETPDPDGLLWQAQPIAAQACLVLREACQESLKTGAAIRFS